MYNLVLLAARPPTGPMSGSSTGGAATHAELTHRLPGLRAWRHTEIDTALEPRSEGWDGVSVLGFDTAEDLRKALDSPEWAAAVAQVGDMQGRRIAVMGSEKDMLAG